MGVSYGGEPMNIKNIRNKVTKAIKSADFRVDILRDEYVDDGAGGQICHERGVVAFTLDCVIDNSKGAKPDGVPTQYSNPNVNRDAVLVCLYDTEKMPKEGDYFMVGDKKYIIGGVDDVLMLHIYLQCPLKAVDADVKKH